MSTRGPRHAGRRSDRLRAATCSGLLVLASLALAAFGPATAAAADGSSRVRVLPEVPVTATNLILKPANNSPALVADPTNGRFVVMPNRLDGPDFSCALQASGDGGRSWVTPKLPTLPPAAEKCYAPEAAFDRHGKLYYLFVGLAGGGNGPIGAFLTTTGDRARSFSKPWRVLGPERFGVRMAIDPTFGPNGRIHLVWLEARSTPTVGGMPPPPNPIMTAHSDDGGRTFSKPIQISDPNRSFVVAPALALGPDHAVHVVYYDLGDDVRDYEGLEGPTWDGNWSLVMTSSRNGGTTFEPAVVVDDGVVPPERVMLIYTMPPVSVVAGRSGRVYVGWYDGRNGDWDVFVRSSPDSGRTWGKPQRVNDDPVGDKRHQYLPRLSLAPDGRLDVIFYDRRSNVENIGNDVYYSSSHDHGASFGHNVKLTTWNFDSRIGYQYAGKAAEGLVEFGGRLGLLSRRSSVVAAWTDTRYTARGFPAQDIMATEIDYPHSSGLPWWAPLAGLGAATGLLAALRRWRAGRAEPSDTGEAHDTGDANDTGDTHEANDTAEESDETGQELESPGEPVEL